MNLWSDWLKLDLPGIEGRADYQWPGVYKIRIVDEHNAPVVIGRFLATDKGGLLAIGESKNVAHRLKQFYRAFNGKEFKHSVANRFFIVRYALITAKSTFNIDFLEFTAFRLANKAAAQAEEERLLKKYFKTYGELPPLNGAMPEKNNISWETL
jgi:hypothetical protein